MLDLEKVDKLWKKNSKNFKENPSRGILIVFVILFFIGVGILAKSYLDQTGKYLADKNYNNVRQDQVFSDEVKIDNKIEISQILFFKSEEEFIIEFSVKNSSATKVLINKIDIELSKLAPETGGGGPLDMESTYNIVFDESFLKLKENNVSINNKAYISYVRDYKVNSTEGSEVGLKLSFEAPFVLDKDAYVPFRISIPLETRVNDLVFGGNKFDVSESLDIKEMYENKNKLTTLNEVDNLLNIENMGAIYIKLHTDDEDTGTINGSKSLFSESIYY